MANTKNPVVTDEVITINVQPFILPVTIIVSALVFSLFTFFGLKSIANGIKEAGGVTVASNNSGTVAGTTDDTDTTGDSPTVNAGVTSIDDDPVMGDRSKAKVAIVEFSDYECPFCKRHHQDTKDQIIKNFVDTGDAVLVFRDFPLSFHDPLATKEASAANCVQSIAGDSKYFEYGDKIFNTTNSNGSGLDENLLYTDIAKAIGVDGTKIKNCATSQDVADEIAADIKDGSAAGINGTPGFIIGTLKDDGTVEGELVSGAQPYSVFETAIKKYL